MKAQRGQFDERLREKQTQIERVSQELKVALETIEEIRSERTSLMTRIASLETEHQHFQTLRDELKYEKTKANSLQEAAIEKAQQLAEYEVAIKKERQLHAEKLALLEKKPRRTSAQFENS